MVDDVEKDIILETSGKNARKIYDGKKGKKFLVLRSIQLKKRAREDRAIIKQIMGDKWLSVPGDKHKVKKEGPDEQKDIWINKR